MLIKNFYTISNVSIKLTIILLISISLTACAPSISSVKYNPQVIGKPRNCQVDIYFENQRIDRPVKVVGEIKVDDTGFSANCDAQTVHNIIRIKACEAAADAIQLFNVRHPDAWSTCYRANAIFLQYTTGSASRSEQTKEASLGTAWVSEYGYVITNHHVVDNKKKVRLIKHDGEELEAVVFLRDHANDIALLKVNDTTKLPPGLPISKISAEQGSTVFTIGYPHPDILGKSPKLNTGVISGLTGLQDDPRTYQISVPVQSGNSGGPLFNKTGEVIGVVTYKLNALAVFRWTGDLPENVNFAIKSNYIDALFSNITDKKHHLLINAQTGTIEEIGNRVRNSIMLVIAE